MFITSLSYVTGAHSFKAGIQHRWGWAKDLRDDINGDLNQRYRNGTAFEVQTFNTPFETIADVNADLGLFVQETWTTKRLTLNPGLRYDYFNSSIPDQTAPAGRFVPARTFAGVENLPNWKDVTVRMGAAYDLFGDGKTAIKGNIGQYMQSEGSGFASTYNALILDTDTRSWTDTNRDDIAQESELGPTSNRTFGVRRNRNPDPDIRRPYQWVVRLRRPARAAAGDGPVGELQQAVVPRHPLDGQPRHRAVRLHSVYRAGPEAGVCRPDAAGV